MAQSASGLLGASPTERLDCLRHTDVRRRTLVSGLPFSDPSRGENGLTDLEPNPIVSSLNIYA